MLKVNHPCGSSFGIVLMNQVYRSCVLPDFWTTKMDFEQKIINSRHNKMDRFFGNVWSSITYEVNFCCIFNSINWKVVNLPFWQKSILSNFIAAYYCFFHQNFAWIIHVLLRQKASFKLPSFNWEVNKENFKQEASKIFTWTPKFCQKMLDVFPLNVSSIILSILEKYPGIFFVHWLNSAKICRADKIWRFLILCFNT